MNKVFRFAPLLLFAICASVRAEDGLVKSMGFLQPNYIITGIGTITNKLNKDISPKDDNQVKFRISLYYRLFGLDSNRTGLYLGYTQNTIWNIKAPSSPFTDCDYQPEIYTCIDLADRGTLSYNPYAPFFRISLIHKSNGLDGERNRSLNTFKGALGIGEFGRSEFFSLLSLQHSFQLASNNKDYVNYYGNAEITLGHTHVINNCVLIGNSITLRFLIDKPKITGLEGSLYLNPFVGKKIKWAPAFMIQYYNGTAESLIDYRSKTQSVRIGLAFL